MDKRSLLFILCVTSSLFFIQSFFNFRYEEKLRAWQSEKESQEQLQEEPIKKNISPLLRAQESLELPIEVEKTEYYVLENNYQQLVFSSKGAALVEINLPFQNNAAASVVKEIEIDRLIEKNLPQRAYFPKNVAKIFENGQVISKKQSLGKYYPLLRRGNEQKIKAQHFSLNLSSQYPQLSEMQYRLVSISEDSIVFEAEQSHRKIRKSFSFEKKQGSFVPYSVLATVEIEKRTGDQSSLWIGTGIPEIELISAAPAPSIRLRTTRKQEAQVDELSLPKESMQVNPARPDWLCNSNGFFGFILDPINDIESGYRVQAVSSKDAPSRLEGLEDIVSESRSNGYNVYLPLKNGSNKFRFFAGPFAQGTLEDVDSILSKNGKINDYSLCRSYHGWFSFISAPFSRFLFMLMKFFHFLSNSWALSIILLTIFLRLLLYPLNAWSLKSMKRAQKLQPQIAEIQKKYKKEPQKAQLEIMNLYHKTGANPLMGCFPIFIQMPFLIGMFDLLKSTFELRGSSFVPGWIDNLTAPDVAMDFGVSLPFLGSELHLLPLSLGMLMYLQQKWSTDLPKSREDWTEQDEQKALMGTMMPVVFTFLFYKLPSGLNIYWLSSTLLGMLQQLLVNKQSEKESFTTEKK